MRKTSCCSRGGSMAVISCMSKPRSTSKEKLTYLGRVSVRVRAVPHERHVLE